MAFLDNSGDIILDAVLTDTGRARLAKGDGSFKIAKFALGDDEIDYTLYNLNHPSGSAYFDLEIMQTPVLEAFTNNTSTMKSKLISIPRTNILYLPVMRLNAGSGTSGGLSLSSDLIWVAADEETKTLIENNNTSIDDSYIDGPNPDNTGLITIDQGLDTTEIAKTNTLSPDLVETQYIIEIDNRFGSIVGKTDSFDIITVNPSFIDDDQVASYYLSQGTDDPVVRPITKPETINKTTSVLNGPVGTRLRFSINISLDLQSSTFLFERLGTLGTLVNPGDIRQIDSVVRITGATTGYRIDVPVRFIKKI